MKIESTNFVSFRSREGYLKRMMVVQLATLFVLCAFFPAVSSIRVLRVSTTYGEIEGVTMASYLNVSTAFKSVSKFLGVPFAAPPIGPLRLKPPQPPSSWEPKIRQAKTHGNICWQDTTFEFIFNPYGRNYTVSEDCLYLDVYTPNISLSLPVMVYIHGGGYGAGAAIGYPSEVLALQGVVVVVIQYRLGPFGFLTTGDSAAPGNFGMLDQVEALKWVKNNIDKFGGNASKVTIFGESAGGSSVTLHLLSPLSEGLFHQVIAESGVDVSPWATQSVSFGVGFAKELAQKLNCPTGNQDEMVACIRKKEAADIQKASPSTNYQFVDYLQWAPVVDKNFLHDTPQNLRKKGSFKKAPLMISFNSDEAGIILGSMAASFKLMGSVDNGVNSSFFNTFMTRLAHARNLGYSEKTADVIADAMKFMYTPWPDNNDRYALRNQLVNVISDYFYFAPSHEVADIHSRDAPVYMYEFAHDTKVTIGAPWMGVVHLDNVPFDFGIPLSPDGLRYDAADRNVSLFIMAVYVNFARTGDPTPQPVSGVTWSGYNSSHRAYLRVDTNPRMDSTFYPRRMAFWNDYHPKLAQLKFDTKIEVVSGATAGVTIETLSYILLTIIFAIFQCY